jgi:hypothetical protein
MKYQAPFGAADPNDPYVDKNTPGAVAGSKVPAKAIEHPQRELDHLISWAGLTPADTDQELVRKAIELLMRPGYRSVKAIQNTPPGSPAIGDTYVVGDTPTGDWVGHEAEIARWSGLVWGFTSPTAWMHIGLADRTDWRWDHTLGTPAWVQWQATAADIEAATAGKLVTADQLKSARRPYFVASSGGATNVPDSVDTVLTHFTSVTSFLNAGSTLVGGVFTCGAADAGLWEFQGKAAMSVAAAPAAGVLRASWAKNGIAAPFASAYIPNVIGTWSLPDFYSFNLSAGDQVDFRAFQSTSTNRTFSGGSIQGKRIGAA